LCDSNDCEKQWREEERNRSSQAGSPRENSTSSARARHSHRRFVLV
jgi:hypothetical protein